MQNTSKEYDKSIKSHMRNRGYIRATIGVINSDAQNSAKVTDTALTYYSSAVSPFTGDSVKNIYATPENDFAKLDGTRYFLPKRDSGFDYYNNGIVTSDIMGAIKISLGGLHEIKGFTIDFGDCYPTEFDFTFDGGTIRYRNVERVWSTQRIFRDISYVIIKPLRMVNVSGRLRIYRFSCGINDEFTNAKVTNYTSKEYVSDITESIPSTDATLTVQNYDGYYDPDNDDSTMAYLEIGQELKVSFGYDVDGSGNIEWLPESTTYLKSWSANGREATFVSTDRFVFFTQMYKKGEYKPNGISLYDLAVSVFLDIGLSDFEYHIDESLKNVVVKNPIPIVTHAEALQIIANAGRCKLYTDRQNRICIEPSYAPYLSVLCNVEEMYSHSENLLKIDTGTLTAVQYARLGLTASDYESYGITAYDYITNGANILGK